jgi:hypothetical protein
MLGSSGQRFAFCKIKTRMTSKQSSDRTCGRSPHHGKAMTCGQRFAFGKIKARMTSEQSSDHSEGTTLSADRTTCGVRPHRGFATMTTELCPDDFEISRMNLLRLYRSNCRDLHRAKQNLAECVQ